METLTEPCPQRMLLVTLLIIITIITPMIMVVTQP
jgi:hypothetical protein